MNISIICVYNNKKILESCLLNSLKNQEVDSELILIDNEKGEFNSAAEALNIGGSKATGDLLLFVHQDVIFFEKNLEDIIYYCEDYPNLGVAGVAGTDELSGIVKSNGIHNIPPSDMGPINITEIESAQTLDEVLLIIPKQVFNNFKFDEETCYHWHLYGADYCLQLIKNNYSVIVLPIKLYHQSNASSMSLEYYKTLNNILEKYKDDFEYIHTSCLGTHKPNKQAKLKILYYFDKFHLNQLKDLIEKSNILKKILKIFLE